MLCAIPPGGISYDCVRQPQMDNLQYCSNDSGQVVGDGRGDRSENQFDTKWAKNNKYVSIRCDDDSDNNCSAM